MAVIQRIKKPTTRKGKKVLLAKEPKPVEGPKQCIFLQGRNPSDRTRKLLKDVYDLKKPDAAFLSRKNDFVPFEDASLIEKMCYKKEAALFGVGSHSKKRPHNIILGRTFNYGILDMIELGADKFKAMKEFHNMKVLAGLKPCLIFNGPAWDLNQDLKRLKSLFIDFFHREKVESIRLQGLEHALSFTATENGSIYFRSYRILLKKSGQRTPRVELEEIGPSIDFKLRRTKLASDDLYKESCKIPREVKPLTKKNISKDAFGTKLGRIHIGKQDIPRLQTRKMKGLKKTPEEKKQLLRKKKLARKQTTA
ncbi:PREDICTED: ribosome production factor 2 homolog [Papilio xuthus]|uniref:Ribosome production factor 2 homolog n=1 Tax=Papilio xuthus TaxID=66420 RepID=A0AAJ6ZIH7_PAPXU|nr:PREDICTED: ribosome production factor 2 homolog [Papilio xuthus]